MNPVFLFEGQGSIVPLMGKNEYEKNLTYKEFFDYYSSLLEFPVKEIIWDRKKVYKKNTLYAHMIMYCTSLALFRSLLEKDIKPSVLIGHSLGELIALIASGAIDEKDGALLIKKRGELFERAKLVVDSDMIVLVSNNIELKSFLEEIEKKYDISLYQANYNSAHQLVVSYDKRYENIIKNEALQAKVRIIPLNLGIGCHSPYLSCVDNEFRDFIDTLPISKPFYPVYSASFNKSLETPDEIKNYLKKHLLHSVNWQDSITSLINKGFNQFVEVGHTKILKGLLLDSHKNAVVDLAPLKI